MTQRYYQLETRGKEADLYIYGDIVSDRHKWYESDVTSYDVVREIDALEGIGTITVYIKSYGGDVCEGLAIYNALRRSGAKIVTVCDGFACSIASVIFMAGDERVVYDASLIMVHNAWTSVFGANAGELRKAADDMDKITQASKAAYLSRVSIGEEELTALMDAETWLSPEEALEMGFATSLEGFTDADAPNQSARHALFGLVSEALAARQQADPDDEEDPDDTEDDPDGGDGTGTDSDSDDEEEEEEEPEDAPSKQSAVSALCSAVMEMLGKE